MTRAARRATTLVLAALAALMLSAVALADPALAADNEAVHAVAENASGFGTGMWDGMVMAAVFGVLLGIAVFGMSSPAEIHRGGHDETDPHTPAKPEALAESMASASGTERTDHDSEGRGDQQMAP